MVLKPHTATTSPGRTPLSTSPPAADSISAMSCAKVTDRSLAISISAILSGCWRPRSSTTEPKSTSGMSSSGCGLRTGMRLRRGQKLQDVFWKTLGLLPWHAVARVVVHDEPGVRNPIDRRHAYLFERVDRVVTTPHHERRHLDERQPSQGVVALSGLRVGHVAHDFAESLAVSGQVALGDVWRRKLLYVERAPAGSGAPHVVLPNL